MQEIVSSGHDWRHKNRLLLPRTLGLILGDCGQDLAPRLFEVSIGDVGSVFAVSEDEVA